MKSLCSTSIIALVALLASFPSLAVAQETSPPGLTVHPAPIPIAGPGEVLSVLDPETGELFLSIGSGVQGVGILGSTIFAMTYPQIDFEGTYKLCSGPVVFHPISPSSNPSLTLGCSDDGGSLSALTFSPTGFPPGIYGSGTGVISTVPEPSTLGVVGLVSLGLAARRRR